MLGLWFIFLLTHFFINLKFGNVNLSKSTSSLFRPRLDGSFMLKLELIWCKFGFMIERLIFCHCLICLSRRTLLLVLFNLLDKNRLIIWFLHKICPSSVDLFIISYINIKFYLRGFGVLGFWGFGVCFFSQGLIPASSLR